MFITKQRRTQLTTTSIIFRIVRLLSAKRMVVTSRSDVPTRQECPLRKRRNHNPDRRERTTLGVIESGEGRVESGYRRSLWTLTTKVETILPQGRRALLSLLL